MRDGAAADQVELDGSRGDLRRGLGDAVGAYIRDGAHAGGLGEIEEGGDLVSEVRPHNRRDQVEALDPLEGGGVSRWIVPVEVDIGAEAGGGTDVDAQLRQ